jgi:hypothetical protein
MERFLVAQSVEKEAFHPVARARGTTKWSPFGVSRQSLEVKFSEVRSGEYAHSKKPTRHPVRITS